MAKRCPSITKDGEQCQGNVLQGRTYCWAHDPELEEVRREGSRKGGEARANARRAAKQWAAIGEQFGPHDLPAILRACMLSVRGGELEPSQAQAIAALARSSVEITRATEHDERIAALEEALRKVGGVVPPQHLRSVI